MDTIPIHTAVHTRNGEGPKTFVLRLVVVPVFIPPRISSFPFFVAIICLERGRGIEKEGFVFGFRRGREFWSLRLGKGVLAPEAWKGSFGPSEGF